MYVSSASVTYPRRTRYAESKLEAGQDRLANKRVVIWEFASRELSVGDWKPLEFPIPPATEAK